jgi:hypothetical protein
MSKERLSVDADTVDQARRRLALVVILLPVITSSMPVPFRYLGQQSCGLTSPPASPIYRDVTMG